jgi:signal peptidase I
VEFIKENDTLRADDYFYVYRSDDIRTKYMRTIFFTDRAIYRPGQTIYFKGSFLKMMVIKTHSRHNSARRWNYSM